MLHNEARELLVKAFERSHNVEEVCRNFSVSRSTVYRLVKQKRDTGSVELQTSKRGRKTVLSDEDIKNIDDAVQERPDITIEEIIEKLDLHVGLETVRKTIIELGYVYKKKSLHASGA